MNEIGVTAKEFLKVSVELDDAKTKIANLEEERSKLGERIKKLENRLAEQIVWNKEFVDEITKTRNELKEEQFKYKMAFDESDFVLYRELPDKTLFYHAFNDNPTVKVPCVARCHDGDYYIVRYDTKFKYIIPYNTRIKKEDVVCLNKILF